MPNSKVEQWLIDNPNASSCYSNLVKLIRFGQPVECVIEFNQGSILVNAEHRKTGFGELFTLTRQDDDEASVVFSMESEFIAFCEVNNVLFGNQDFLESTRKMLEIAKNAAQFKAISLPLNSPEDIEAILALMDRANAVSTV